MTLNRLFTLLLFLALAVTANAQTEDLNKAKDLLNSLYKAEIFSNIVLDYGNKNETSKYFNSDLVKLLYSDNKHKIETQETGVVDWVLSCSCQDYSPNDFSFVFETKSAKPIQIISKINNSGHKTEILFDFTKENGELRISDIKDGDGYSRSLKKMLKMYLK